VFKISIKYLYGSCINSLGLFIKMSDKYPVLPGPTIYPAAVSDGLSRYVQAPAKAVSFGGATCTSSCYLYGCRKNSQRIKYKLSQNKSQITEPWHHDYVRLPSELLLKRYEKYLVKKVCHSCCCRCVSLSVGLLFSV